MAQWGEHSPADSRFLELVWVRILADQRLHITLVHCIDVKPHHFEKKRIPLTWLIDLNWISKLC